MSTRRRKQYAKSLAGRIDCRLGQSHVPWRPSSISSAEGLVKSSVDGESVDHPAFLRIAMPRKISACILRSSVSIAVARRIRHKRRKAEHQLSLYRVARVVARDHGRFEASVVFDIFQGLDYG